MLKWLVEQLNRPTPKELKPDPRDWCYDCMMYHTGFRCPQGATVHRLPARDLRLEKRPPLWVSLAVWFVLTMVGIVVIIVLLAMLLAHPPKCYTVPSIHGEPMVYCPEEK